MISQLSRKNFQASPVAMTALICDFHLSVNNFKSFVSDADSFEAYNTSESLGLTSKPIGLPRLTQNRLGASINREVTAEDIKPATRETVGKAKFQPPFHKIPARQSQMDRTDEFLAYGNAFNHLTTGNHELPPIVNEEEHSSLKTSKRDSIYTLPRTEQKIRLQFLGHQIGTPIVKKTRQFGPKEKKFSITVRVRIALCC